MRNNTRRNRNIGTSKQGYGQNNSLTIPSPYLWRDGRFFAERLARYEKLTHRIHGYDFVFVVEQTRPDCYHSCTPADVAHLLSYIPEADYGELRLIVFRQPKRKEEIINPVWARLIYEYEFENQSQPAIILESCKTNDYLKWSKRLTVDNKNEFERLQKDGHKFIVDKRYYIAKLTPENVRNTQLYRSLPHEFGHYAHFLNTVEKPDSFASTKEMRYHYYMDSITTEEKEKYAHAYADNLRADLLAKNIIHFESKAER